MAAPRYEQPQWQAILDVLWKRIDDPEERSCQIPAVELAEITGVTTRTLFRYFTDMRRLDILRWSIVKVGFDGGRQPNRYKLLVDPNEWRGRWVEYIFGPDPTTLAPDDPAQHGVEFAWAENIPPDVQETLDKLNAGDDEIEVDAWLAGSA